MKIPLHIALHHNAKQFGGHRHLKPFVINGELRRTTSFSTGKEKNMSLSVVNLHIVIRAPLTDGVEFVLNEAVAVESVP